MGREPGGIRRRVTVNIRLTISLLALLGGMKAASGQQFYSNGSTRPNRLDLTAGYSFIRANAPPSACGCFNMNGAFVTANSTINPWLGMVGSVNAGHAKDISSLGQNLTLTTFMGGPRVSLNRNRLSTFGEAEFGVARATGSYFPSGTSSSSKALSFAYSTGGGLDMKVNERMGIRLFEAEYLHTSLPNGVNTAQNQLRIRTGVTFHFGFRSPIPQVVDLRTSPKIGEPKPLPLVSFSCHAENPKVYAGENIRIVGESKATPADLTLEYTWATNGGVVRGAGLLVSIDTTTLTPGNYRVNGLAAISSNSFVNSSCEAAFAVEAKPEVNGRRDYAVASSNPSSVQVEEQSVPVKDVYFDYNEMELREDAQEAIATDAKFLIAHPLVNITIAGFADERGSAEYNVTLGMRRAVAMRASLIALGVDASRIQIMSFGKEKGFCEQDSEECYKLNRRAQILVDRIQEAQGPN